MLALVNGRVFTGERTLDGHAVLVEGGRIARVAPLAGLPRNVERVDLGGGLLAPGFIDLQVNGGGGVLFNDQPTPEGIAAIASAHRRFGTTGFLPTLITTDRATMERALAAVLAARAAKLPGVLGIHFEGPHLNPRRKGIHDAHHMRPPSACDLDLLASPGAGRTLVTLAPECVPASAIRALRERGVIVSAGHTDGTYEEVSAGIAAGISGFTHLYNAMSPLAARAPGAVGAAFAIPHAWCGIIVDLHHVHPAAVRVAWQAKPRGMLLLTTDAMPPVGTGLREFRLGERRILVEHGRCTGEDGVLAGSALDMASAVRNAVRQVGIPLEEALRMASAYPAAALGLAHELGRIAPGMRADLVLLDRDLHARATWIADEGAWNDPKCRKS